MDQIAGEGFGNSQSDGVGSVVGEKRPLENVENGELAVRLGKKQRCGHPCELKRVAEMVLVLSAIGRMRGGGKDPTDAELGLMADARAKLAEICQGFAPKDIVGRDAIGAVIEDLGLNGKFKDQRLGFRVPKLTISEKVSMAKRKMEESKKFVAPSATFTPNSGQQSGGVAAERPNPSLVGSATHTVRMIGTDRPGHAPVSSGPFPPPSSTVHITSSTSTSLPHQLPIGNIKTPTVSAGLGGLHFKRDSLAMPRFERPLVKLDGGSNGSTSVSQLSAMSSANHPLINAPTWSLQSQSALLTKPAVESKASNNNPVKAEGSGDLSASQMVQAARDQSFRPFISQTAPGNFPSLNQPVQNMNFAHASTFGNSHNDIAKIVQNLLQSHLPQCPSWTPPSREYMNKALTCQMCKLTINEVENVLICDACEKGFHLKCLQSSNLKSIPKPEWHCTRCTQLCNGKPLPPKYGRVMRSVITPKVPANTAVVQSSSEKKIGTLDAKVIHQQKINVNQSSGLHCSLESGTVSSNFAEASSELKTPSMKEVLGNNVLLNKIDIDQRTSATCSQNPICTLEAVCVSSLSPLDEKSDSHNQTSESSTQQKKLVFASEEKLDSHNQASEWPTQQEKLVSASEHKSDSHNPTSECSPHQVKLVFASEDKFDSHNETSEGSTQQVQLVSSSEDKSDSRNQFSESSSHQEILVFASEDKSDSHNRTSECSTHQEKLVFASEDKSDSHNKTSECSTHQEKLVFASEYKSDSNNQISECSTHQENLVSASEGISDSHNQTSECSHQEKLVSASEDISEPPVMPSDAVSKSDDSQPSLDMQNFHTDMPSGADVSVDSETKLKDSEKNHVGKDDDNTSITKEDQQVVEQEILGNSGSCAVDREHDQVSSEGCDGVEWIGDDIHVGDDKKKFHSCRIRGMVYKVEDHILFCSSDGKLIPSKLQAMGEDIKTGSKWALVNMFYFSSDLPEAVVCPSTPENNEVYKSNNDKTIALELIQGLCEVLPAPKFKEENERRKQLGTEVNEGSTLLFQCKWSYDEFKGIFEPFSS